MDKGTLDDLAEAQRTLNRSSAERWELFREHRERLTDLIIGQLAAGRSRVCVLGAGNCNDLDLARLAGAGAELHLVDIDGDALRQGVARQSAALPEGGGLHGGIDVTGVWPELALLRGREAGAAALEHLIARADRAVPLPVPAPFDVVVSPTVLTQIVASAGEVVGAAHPLLDPLALALRAGHIRTMLALLRPGGCAILATEIASSREVPELQDAPDSAVPGLALRTILLQQAYKAASPPGIVSWLARERPLKARLAAPGVAGPWRWRLSRRVCYLVVAVLFTRP